MDVKWSSTGLNRVKVRPTGLTSVTSRAVNTLRATANPTGLNNVTVAIGAGLTGVSSFNNRTGAVTLEAGDVINALGYNPANAANLTFANLTDVQITNPSQSDTPQYNVSNGKWINIPQTSITDGGNF